MCFHSSFCVAGAGDEAQGHRAALPEQSRGFGSLAVLPSPLQLTVNGAAPEEGKTCRQHRQTRQHPRAGSQGAPSLGHWAGNNLSQGSFLLCFPPQPPAWVPVRCLRDHLSLISLEPGKSGEIQREEAPKSLCPRLWQHRALSTELSVGPACPTPSEQCTGNTPSPWSRWDCRGILTPLLTPILPCTFPTVPCPRSSSPSYRLS